MGKVLPLMVLYGSFLSLPAAGEKGTLALTLLYIVFAFFSALTMVTFRLKQPGRSLTQSELFFLALVLVVFFVNFFVATFNGIPMSTWVARFLHVPMILIYYLVIRYSDLSPRDVLKSMFIMGMIEVFLIFFAFLTGVGMDQGRATDIEGVIIYSIMFVIAAFISLFYYNESRRPLFLWLYFAVLLASVLTGTRGLILCVALIILVLPLNWIQIVAFFVSVLGTYYLLVNGYLDRFNIQDEDNVITILAKLEELQILWQFFKDSPVWGVGFGHQYQTSIANAPYTYSHNALLFYLGYGGLLALPLYLGPLLQFVRTVPKGLFLAGAILVFYTTSTSFTNVKHSIAMAAFIFIAARVLEHRSRSRSSGAASAAPHVT